MLEQMRRSSQSLLIYVLFAIVIAVFIINFGPQSGGGCGAEARVRPATAAEVDGRTIGWSDFKYGQRVAAVVFGADGGRTSRLKEQVMDALIQRELLVQQGERIGLRVGQAEVDEMVTDSKMLAFGQMKRGPFEKDGVFDNETFTKWVQFGLQMTPGSFFEQQRKELMAARMRDLLRGSVNVASTEVKEQFEQRNNQVNLEYVSFPWSRYKNDVEVSEADVAAYVKDNEKKLKDLYDQRKESYQNLQKERRLRQILVKLPEKVTPEATKAAEKKADALAARVKKGEAFAAVAKAASEDLHTKARGGDMGWKREGKTTLGLEVEAKVWPAKDGEVVGPLKSGTGFVIVKVEATREGTQAFEKVRDELAETALIDEKAKAKAKADAEAALAKANAAKDKTLKDLFPATPDALDSGHAARAEETGLFIRRGNQVGSIGSSAEMAKAAFALTKEKPTAGPFEVSSAYYVLKLKERKQPDLAEFEKKKGELTDEATLMRGSDVLKEWTQRRCTEVKDAKRISVNLDVLRYDDNPETPVAYEPCAPPPSIRVN
jgi:peptidyl-prolyl cis-trans isomerase D